MVKINKTTRRIKRRKSIRSKLFGTKTRPRLSVFRSNKYIYAQIVDDERGQTLVSAHGRDVVNKEQRTTDDTEPKRITRKKPVLPAGRSVKSKTKSDKSVALKKYSKTDRARLLGKLLAKIALKKKIKTVVFDRGGYKYHGRVKAFAEGARKGGLKF